MRTEEKSVAIDPQHPNEEWWHEHGGANWLRELESRRPTQKHYGQQEAFLAGFFRAIPPVTVLDFGCGFGRHIKSLRAIPGVEVHGCDFSSKMVEAASDYIGDAKFAKDRIRLIQPRSALPYGDGSFDIALTSEVLIHVESVDAIAIARELWRVSSSMIIHIENRLTAPSQRENDAHSGCWLHDFKAIYENIGPADLVVLPDVIEKQCIYLVTKPGSRLAGAGGTAAEQRLSKHLSDTLHSVRRDLAEVRNELVKVQSEREQLRDSLRSVQISTPVRLGERARRLPLPNSARRAFSKLASKLSGPAPEPPAPLDDPTYTPQQPVDLSFAGVATRASRPSAVQFVEEQPQVVAICHPDWRGIRAASYGQSSHVLEVPGITSSEHLDRLVCFIDSCNARRLVVNGFPPGIDQLAIELARKIQGLDVYFVYHGTPAQFHFREDKVLQRILELVDAGAVRRLGFVKHGLAEYVRSMGYPAQFVMNICRMPFRPVAELGPDRKVHIGIFAQNVCHKNIQIQLMAALMIPGAVVHVSEVPEDAYFRRDFDRIVEHGGLPHSEFIALLGEMQATLCVSLAECYPMTVLESLCAGAVCLTSRTSVLFEDQPDLLAALVVPQHDNPYAIARRLAAAIDQRHNLVPRAQAYLAELNSKAEMRWHEFLSP